MSGPPFCFGSLICAHSCAGERPTNTILCSGEGSPHLGLPGGMCTPGRLAIWWQVSQRMPYTAVSVGTRASVLRCTWLSSPCSGASPRGVAIPGSAAKSVRDKLAETPRAKALRRAWVATLSTKPRAKRSAHPLSNCQRAQNYRMAVSKCLPSCGAWNQLMISLLFLARDRSREWAAFGCACLSAAKIAFARAGQPEARPARRLLWDSPCSTRCALQSRRFENPHHRVSR